MTGKVIGIENELKDFRTETTTSLQILQTDQKGMRAEITQRFKEPKKSLERLKSDLEFTYQKTAMHELKLHRIESNPIE